MHNKAQKMGLKWVGPLTQSIPTANRPIDTLFADSLKDFERKRAHHSIKRSGVVLRQPTDEPFGVLWVGDPHLGDPGCNLGLLAHHLDIAKKTPGLQAVNMGDLCNWWVGRLQRLYSSQHVTDDEEVELARWLLQEIPWAFCILGNHDRWGPVAELLCKQYKVPYSSHGAKLIYKTPSREIKVDARHNHRGNSMYNPAHAQVKKNHRGSDCDIIIGAHLHISADVRLRNGVTGQLSHCIRVGSYKEYDDYADSGDMQPDTIGPAWMSVIDPLASSEALVQGFWDIEAGADYLKFLRSRR